MMLEIFRNSSNTMKHLPSDDFVCDYCRRSFSRKHYLQYHIQVNHINSTNSCEICNQRFKSSTRLFYHLSRGHNRNRQPFPECDLCGRIFTRKPSLIHHMLTVHTQDLELKIQCKFCSKTFNSERIHKRHLNSCHNPSVILYNCVYLKLQTTQLKLKCQFCTKLFCNNLSLKRHIDVYHGQKKQFECDLCSNVYSYNQSLHRHIKLRHSSGNQLISNSCKETRSVNLDVNTDTFQSQESNSMFSEKDAYQTLNYICRICHRGFHEESNLRNHMKSEHSFQMFYEYCKNSLLEQEKSTNTKSRNRSTCKNRKPSTCNCEYCYNSFVNVSALENHMKVFHNKEFYLSTCNVCFSKFYSMETILIHKTTCLPPPNVHSCTNCNKLFTDISSLEFHTRVFHTQAKSAESYVKSNRKENLTNVPTNKCTICSCLYYNYGSLERHIKFKHTTEISDGEPSAAQFAMDSKMIEPEGTTDIQFEDITIEDTKVQGFSDMMDIDIKFEPTSS